ncbi:MAG: hypothetical protein K2Y37_22080 [Pirellulales bacterium]|nr:hypothetical protein [Pirellulales bacterium]
MPQYHRDSAQQVHICHLEASKYARLVEAVQNPNRSRPEQGWDEMDWWNINKHAKRGDRLIIYVTRPRSAFVASAIVKSEIVTCPDIESEFRKKPCVWIDSLRLLKNELTLALAKDHFPGWGFLRSPISSTVVPKEIVDQLLGQLDGIMVDEASDLAAPAERILTRTYRILRDTELARHVKHLHGHQCQLCGYSIRLPNGLKYAEAHHIQPLGSPHDGPDVIGNVLCVCPNHHAELDLGAIPICLAELRHASGHVIDTARVEYHNTRIHVGEPPAAEHDASPP